MRETLAAVDLQGSCKKAVPRRVLPFIIDMSRRVEVRH